MSPAAKAGALFVALFVAAFIVSLGDLVGAFADRDSEFVNRFADDGKRVKDIAGAHLLTLAGLSFVWLRSRETPKRAAARSSSPDRWLPRAWSPPQSPLQPFR